MPVCGCVGSGDDGRGGEIIYRPVDGPGVCPDRPFDFAHPDGRRYAPGTIWQCECGIRYERNGPDTADWERVYDDDERYTNPYGYQEYQPVSHVDRMLALQGRAVTEAAIKDIRLRDADDADVPPTPDATTLDQLRADLLELGLSAADIEAHVREASGGVTVGDDFVMVRTERIPVDVHYLHIVAYVALLIAGLLGMANVLWLGRLWWVYLVGLSLVGFAWSVRGDAKRAGGR